MASFLKKIGNLFNSINGISEPEEKEQTTKAESRPKPEPRQKTKQEPKAAAAAKPESENEPTQAEEPEQSIYNNAIDKRFRAVNLITDEFKEALGTKSSSMASLTIYVIVDREDYDVKKYAWADDEFRNQLRVSLDHAMLESIGKKSLTIKMVTAEALPSSAKPVAPGELYYSFKTAPKPVLEVKARITVMEGTGSLEKPFYELDSKKKTVYHIGRSETGARIPGARYNDIVICADDKDTEIQGRNNFVSSNHADISVKEGRFYINALRGGCRPLGGAATKIIFDDKEYELRDTKMKFPLKDGMLIELGKSVVLIFNTVSD